MAQNGIFRMFVAQYELIVENNLGEIPEKAVASLNTHDIFPFAAFWKDRDIAERKKLNLIDREVALEETAQRSEVKKAISGLLPDQPPGEAISRDMRAVLIAILELLSASPAYALIVNLEDLWEEIRAQNIPGTQRRQNWTRKVRFSFEEFSRMPQVLEILRQIDRKRKGVNQNSKGPG